MKQQLFCFNVAGLGLEIKCPEQNFVSKNFKQFILPHKNSKNNLYSCELKHFDERLVCYLYSQILASNNGMLLHATAVAKKDAVFIFFAKAGGGKSTVADLSRHYQVIGDDVIALRKLGGNQCAFATPWKQRTFINSGQNTRGKIAAMFFLKKSSRVYFKPLPPEEALVRILTTHVHFFTYSARKLAEKIFYTASVFVKNAPAYEMGFTKSRNFWPQLEEALGGA